MDDDYDELQDAQIERRLNNLIRIGQVEQVDYSQARARVRCGAQLTDWIAWTSLRAGGDRDWVAPEVGEAVVILALGGRPELSVIIGSIYHDAHPANGDRADLRRVTFADGTVCEYDRAAHRFTLNVPAGGAEVVVNSGGQVTVAAAGHLNLTSEAEIYLAAPSIAIQGPVTQVGGDIVSDGISLKTHVHGGVEPGSGVTTPPN